MRVYSAWTFLTKFNGETVNTDVYPNILRASSLQITKTSSLLVRANNVLEKSEK